MQQITVMTTVYQTRLRVTQYMSGRHIGHIRGWGYTQVTFLPAELLLVVSAVAVGGWGLVALVPRFFGRLGLPAPDCLPFTLVPRLHGLQETEYVGEILRNRGRGREAERQ